MTLHSARFLSNFHFMFSLCPIWSSFHDFIQSMDVSMYANYSTVVAYSTDTKLSVELISNQTNNSIHLETLADSPILQVLFLNNTQVFIV